MRLNINLASRPYEDARRFYLTWIPVTLALLLVAITTSVLSYQRYQESRNVRSQLADKHAQMAQLDKEYSDARATLDLPQNSGTRDQSRFLNDLFQRKSFSWTKVLSDLETVMPTGVQVVSIKPELNQQGQLQFALTVAADRREDAINLTRNMEKSPRFFQPAIRAEHTKADTKGNRITVDIVSQYVPVAKRGKS